jgi:hypothetical protein
VKTRITRSALGALLVALANLAVPLKAGDAVPLSERTFRVIEGTESPDRRFALGVGRATDRVKPGQRRWIKGAPSEAEEGLADTDALPNYLVDLREGVIVDETGCGYPSANPNYNRATCAAHWSPDSRMVVQVTTFQNRYGNASLLRIDPDGRRVSPPFDLQAAAEERAIAFLKKRCNRAWSQDKEFAVKPLFVSVTNDTVAVTMWGEVVHSHKRDDRWAVRVKARITTNDKLKVRPEFLSVRYPHEGTETETKLSHHSPDGKFAMCIVHDAGHELWSSLFIHRIELLALPEKKVVAQLLPANETGTTFLTEGLELIWSEDSKWCAFHFAYPGRGGDPSGYTIVFRESGGNFVAANKPNQLRSASRDRDAEGRLSEDVMPVRWIKPGTLLLKQRAEIVADSQTETTWRLEAAYDPKIHAMHFLKSKELSAEETEKFDVEIQAMRGKE